MSDSGRVDEIDAEGGRRGLFARQPRSLKVAAALLLLGAVGVGGWLLGSRGDGQKVDIEPANAIGMDPFTTEAISFTSAADSSSTTKAPGLYGGSGDNGVCAPEKLVSFLKANPSKAKAWVAAFNSDPTLTWSGGNKLKVSDIPAYVDELKPVILQADTLVTNHGYKNGKQTPRQSLLKAGTAAMVDANGVPRIRCYCGNPLNPPAGGGQSTTSTTAERTTTTEGSVGSEGTTTTIGGDIDFNPECEPIAAMPSGATNVSASPVDFNGAGAMDLIRVYQLGSVWRVRAEVDGAPVSDVVLAGTGPMSTIGGAAVDGYPFEEAWVKVGTGSTSTDIIGLLMLLDCDLKRVELNGSPGAFPIGAGATTADGLGCYGFGVGIEVFTSTSNDAVTYNGTSQIYTIDVTGPTPIFVAGATANQSETDPSPGFTGMSSFNCGNLTSNDIN